MKRILLLILACALLFTAFAEETETVFAAGPAALGAGTEIYSDEGRAVSVGKLAGRLIAYASDLITGEEGSRTLKILYLFEGTLRTGYVNPPAAIFLTEAETEAYIAETAKPDGYYGELPLMNAVFQKEEPDEPDEPDRPKRKKQVRITGEERGTPGVYTHVHGSWETELYWGVDTDDCETAGDILLLGGEEIGIGGENLLAEVNGTGLVLTGESVSVTGEALLTLRESGIGEVTVNGLILPTDGFLSGSIYGSLRASGISDRMIDYVFDASGVTASAMGEHYAVHQNAESGAWELERSGA